MSEDFNTVCPFCGYRHNAVTAIYADVDLPEDGNTTMCFGCGRFYIFDSAVDGGLRQPTKKEQRELDRNDDLQKLCNAWKLVKRG